MALFEGYRPKGRWIDKIDPRTKLLWVVFLLVTAFVHTNYLTLSLLLLLTLVTSLLAGSSIRSLYASLFVLAIISFQLLLIQLVFSREGYVLFSVGPLNVYSEALPLAAKASLKLGLIMLVGMQFLNWTPPDGITLMLVKAGVPYRFAMLVGLAMRFLPLMERELKAVFEIQRARGLPMESISQKLKNLLPVLMPFLFRALRRANDTALAMELRGFGYASTRTFLHDLYFKRMDVVIISVMATAMTLLLATASKI